MISKSLSLASTTTLVTHFLCLFCYCFWSWGHTYSQNLFLTLCSGITPFTALGTIWVVGNHIWVDSIHGQCLYLLSSLSSPFDLLFLKQLSNLNYDAINCSHQGVYNTLGLGYLIKSGWPLETLYHVLQPLPLMTSGSFLHLHVWLVCTCICLLVLGCFHMYVRSYNICVYLTSQLGALKV